MAVVKIKFIRHLKTLVQYVDGERDPGDESYGHDCLPQTVTQDFAIANQQHPCRGLINAIHVVQSWKEEESCRLSPKEINEMGVSLASQYFEGHMFTVTTHTGTDRYHNHIIVNPWHSETGKKIENKKYHYYNLKILNDKICKEKGLSIINGDAIARREKMPETARNIARHKGVSYLFDLAQTADFVRSFSTSYDEYVDGMKRLGITVRVENENITYFYPGFQRPKRGSKMPKRFDKPGLEETFKLNDEKFKGVPGLRGSLGTAFEKFAGGTKDYSKFTKVPRRGGEGLQIEFNSKNCIIPLDEISKASKGNILEFCKRNKIDSISDAKGNLALKGREYVTLKENEWHNSKNKTSGSLIQFVANYYDISFLQSIAKINNNNRLLLFEKHFGEVKRPHKSFYVPKTQQEIKRTAHEKVSSLLRSKGIHTDMAESLLMSGQVKISKSGRVRFFGKEDDLGTMEFEQENNGGWKQKKFGSITAPFFSAKGSGRSLAVYTDVFTFIKNSGKSTFSGSSSRSNILCLLEPNEKIVDRFLSKNQDIQRLEIVKAGKDGPNKVELDFFNNLKTKHKSLGMEFVTHTFEKPGHGLDLDISL